MKYSIKHLLTIISALIITGCATGPTQSQLENADYGNQMSLDDCITIAENKLTNSLKDPGSAQFKHTDCHKGYWPSIPILGMSVAFGWVQKGEVNGKNSYGGYVGFRPYTVLINNGQVVRYCISDRDGSCIARN